MKQPVKTSSIARQIVSIGITFVIVKVIEHFSGFHYDIAEGFFNIKLLIDLALWVLVYFSVFTLLNKLWP